MITTEQSYELGMSPNEYYQLERSELFRLVAEKGDFYHVMSRSWESGVCCRCIELIDGFLLTEEGDIVSAHRWIPMDPPEPKRKPIKPSVRFQILKRDGYRCQLCGATANDGAKLEIDHIVPVAKGGTNDLSNLQVLCRDCNSGKSDNML
jgi:hypothetical protein